MADRYPSLYVMKIQNKPL